VTSTRNGSAASRNFCRSTPTHRWPAFRAQASDGRWSASHWKTAVFGWLAFVVAAFSIGSVVGTKNISDDYGTGQSHRADQILKEGFPTSDALTEIVLVQSSSKTVSDPQFRATVNDVVAAVKHNSAIKNIKSPLNPANSDQVSKGSRTAMVTWEMKGKYDHAKTKIDAIEAAVTKVGDRHPAFSVGEAGAVSSQKALDNQPPLSWRGVRRLGRRFPVGLGRESARVPGQRRHRVVAADLHVRRPLRALNGLPRLHPEPDPRGLRPRLEDGGRSRPRHHDDRRRRLECALVMVGAFAVFALMPILDMKEMGIGLAAAVLIDATIVRAVLLPATMKLLGDANWYLPRWLEWLPRLDHEPTVKEKAPAAAPAPAAGA
jgi:MMPL family